MSSREAFTINPHLPLRPIGMGGAIFEGIFNIDDTRRREYRSRWERVNTITAPEEKALLMGVMDLANGGINHTHTAGITVEKPESMATPPDPTLVTSRVRAHVVMTHLDLILNGINGSKGLSKNKKSIIKQGVVNTSAYLGDENKQELLAILESEKPEELAPSIRANIYARLGVYPSQEQYFQN